MGGSSARHASNGTASRIVAAAAARVCVRARGVRVGARVARGSGAAGAAWPHPWQIRSLDRSPTPPAYAEQATRRPAVPAAVPTGRGGLGHTARHRGTLGAAHVPCVHSARATAGRGWHQTYHHHQGGNSDGSLPPAPACEVIAWHPQAGTAHGAKPAKPGHLLAQIQPVDSAPRENITVLVECGCKHARRKGCCGEQALDLNRLEVSMWFNRLLRAGALLLISCQLA